MFLTVGVSFQPPSTWSGCHSAEPPEEKTHISPSSGNPNPPVLPSAAFTASFADLSPEPRGPFWKNVLLWVVFFNPRTAAAWADEDWFCVSGLNDFTPQPHPRRITWTNPQNPRQDRPTHSPLYIFFFFFKHIKSSLGYLNRKKLNKRYSANKWWDE